MAQNHEVTLPNVVGERLLEVADYQRPYAWEGKQLGDLWEDLDLLGTGNRHYAGTLVLKRVGEHSQITSDGVELSRFEVVDGQQRLTTCFILLDRVRRRLAAFAANDEDAAKAVTRLSDTYRQVTINGAKVPRLMLGPELNQFWVDTILGDHPAAAAVLVAGHQRLKAAAGFFDARIDALLDGVTDEIAVRRLLDLQLRVTSGLRFLVYEVESDAEVGVIFETLNERGRALTELEKVKNYLLYLARQIPDGRQGTLGTYINSSWAKMFNNLAGRPAAAEEQLLRAHWLATQNPDSRKWKGIDSVKARFPRSRYVPGTARLSQVGIATPPTAEMVGGDPWDELHGDVEAYVRTLTACSTFLAEMHNPQAAYVDFDTDHARVRAATAALLRGPIVAIFRPLFFACRLSHPSNGVLYADLVRLCEAYVARVFVIAQRRGNAGEPYLCQIAHRLFQGGDTDQFLSEVRARLWVYATDEQVRAALDGEDDWYGRQAHKWFLYEYELSLVANPADVRPFEDFVDTRNRKTTEHVLPQNPDKDSDWWDRFTEVDHQRLVHTLGNLALTYDNSAYSNHEYAVKRGTPGQTKPACYATATLAQERMLASDYSEWTPEAVRARQGRLADWAMEHWMVPAPAAAAVRVLDEDLDMDSDEESLMPSPSPESVASVETD